MAYTVLARKFRSRTFDEIAGQDAIATTLRNAVESGRIHHGYLFTGTRGVGKTSMARILAKSLNCLSADKPTPKPCLECESCRMVAEGEDIDVIEIDAASHTGVDNIRDLRGNSIYRPARARFKIFIIDEVHMLSTGAFNALLKTLEEPPSHVKFILATTEIQKVPATIQSRCQRFDFRSIDMDTISARLRSILDDEQVEADPTVIRRVARLANGSMRDALSLLDQLLAFGSAKLDEELIEQVLPTAHNELVFELVDRIGAQDPAAALSAVEECLGSGLTHERLCESLIEHLRSLMVLAVCGGSTELLDVPSQVRDQLVEQSRRFDATTYIYMIALVQELRRAVKFSAAGRALVDAAVVRLALAEQFSDLKTVIASLSGSTRSSGGPATAKNNDLPVAKPPISKPAPTPDRSRTASQPPEPSGAPPSAHARPPIEPLVRDKVMSDRSVRRAMELFEGSVQDIRPQTNSTTGSTAGGTPAPLPDDRE